MADKAHQLNLIVKACLNTPVGDYSEGSQPQKTERLRKRRRGFEFPAALWHSRVRHVYFLKRVT